MQQTQRPDHLRTIVLVLATVAVIRLWMMPIGNSFWLDETITVWAIGDGFSRIFQDVAKTAQSILFCALEWLVSQLLGTSEIALRVPALAAGIGGLYIYYRIGVEFLDREAGLIFGSLYLMLQQVVIEIPNARPYALALFAEAAALLWLFRWIRTGRIWHGVAWMLCAVLSGHMHHVFFVALPLEGVFIVRSISRGSSVKWRQLLLLGAVGAISLAPAIPQLLVTARQGKLLSFVEQRTLVSLLSIFAPAYLLPAAALFTLLEWVEGRYPRWTPPKAGHIAVLGAILLFAPALGFLILSQFSGVQLFQMRYLLPTVPGIVLLWGWLIRGFESRFLSYMSVAAGLLVAILVAGEFSAVPDYHREDWRSAVRSMPESGAVLLYSGLVETRRLDWLQSPEHWNYFTAPLLAYRPSVARRDAFLMPFEVGSTEQDYVAGLISGPLRNRSLITVIIRRLFWGPVWASWITQRLADAGYIRQSDVQYERVEVAVFRHL